ncbi:hypothetical protein F0P96_07785 [Hymenobacter busanensis]|uniref:Uncharacterized protein n=1 Tax=Hymenobacter busanensis TaxID=2607656 RepID=A0A7L5A0Q9_9BACT|nr:hypothetical protein [Hymenobacter busanensis]KAA9338712.1 hypothetical protein F0P96_07785 [Hymenobacter busanensis]QHJ08857.1 hypothetical protein GUY19_16815 [Hymenobacter busanensis]
MPNSFMSPMSRRVTGSLLMVAGTLLLLAQLIRFGIAAVEWQQGSGDAVGATYLILTVLMLLLGVLLIRYGWRMRRDGHVSDEPGDHSIS